MIVTTERECAGRTVTLRAATRGATLLNYRLGDTEIIDGYRGPAELRELNGFRSAVLVPWSNRIRAGATRPRSTTAKTRPCGLNSTPIFR